MNAVKLGQIVTVNSDNSKFTKKADVGLHGKIKDIAPRHRSSGFDTLVATLENGLSIFEAAIEDLVPYEGPIHVHLV